MSDGTRFTGPEESPGFLLWRTTMRWERVMAEALAPYALTHTQFVLLACTWWLGREGEPVSQARVSAFSGSDARMTSEVVRRLEAQGLVSRVTDPADRRVRRLVVTDRGAEVARVSVAAVEDADGAFFGRASGSLVEDLRSLSGVAVRPS